MICWSISRIQTDLKVIHVFFVLTTGMLGLETWSRGQFAEVLVSVSCLALVSSWPRPSTRPDHMQRPRTFVWTASVELTWTSDQDVLHLVFKLIIPMLWIYTDQHLRSVQSHNYTCSTGAELGGTHKTRESRGLSIASLCLSITFSAPSAAPLSFTVQMKKALRGDANTACWL